jgi:hypothetical protein
MTKFFTTAALALSLSAATISQSPAQGVGPGGPMMGMMGGGCPMIGMMGMMGPGMMGPGTGGQGAWGPGMMGPGSRMGTVADARLAYLKGELAITEAQTEAWNAYAEAATTRVDVMQGMRESMFSVMQEGSATERMDARIGGMEAMLEAMKALKPATENLYAALTDEQKKVADQLIGADCGAM